ncbi:WG repeat-containing protein [Winogradskyella tangerina]|uniref:WG repeat-containing protein n=1 Tax=Winogradskyella tangerina TaxID=2023240 RepID=UPI000DBE3E7D|nr:WG repeat-containing protein [Winogradskyella tangerina]
MTREEFYKRYQYSNRTDKIGGGSFGTVYKAYDLRKDIEVAIKVQEVQHLQGKEFSLQIEYDAIKSLDDHPNIANYETVHRFEEGPGVFDYAIMQYYGLGNLSNYLKNNSLSYDEKSRLLVQILQGIAFLHHNGIVHRDIKPSNILVVDRPNEGIIPKITDFGMSKLAEIENIDSSFKNSFKGGTLQYSAPEQLRGLPLKLNADLWSFGIIIYEVFEGRSLFDNDGGNLASVEWQSEIMSQILNKDIDEELEKIPEDWREITKQCLTRDISLRPITGKSLLEQLKPKYYNIDDDHFLTKALSISKTMVSSDIQDATEILDDSPTVLIDEASLENDIETSKNSEETSNAKSNKGKGIKAIIISAISILIVSAFVLFKFMGTASSEQYLAKVKLNGQYGYIDISGNEIIKPQYTNSFGFSNGLAPIQNGAYWAYINTSNEVVLNEFQLAAPFSEGLAAVKKENKWFYIDKSGKKTIDSSYELIGGFKEGLSSFRLNGKWGYINKTGHWLISNMYDMARPFSEGLAGVKQGDHWGYIDRQGKIIIPFQYKNIRDVSDGILSVQLNNNKWVLINMKNEQLIEDSFDDIKVSSTEFIAVKKDNKWLMIDYKGNEVIGPIYDGMGYYVNGLIAVKKNDKWGFIDRNGDTVIDFKYDYADNFKESEK